MAADLRDAGESHSLAVTCRLARRVRALLIVAGLVTASAVSVLLPAAGRADTNPAVTFSGTEPLPVTWNDLIATVPLEVFNDTAKPVVLSFALTPFRASKGSLRLEPARLAEILPPGASLSPGQSVEVSIRKKLGAEKPAADTYTGSIVAFGVGGDAFARRTIVLTIGNTPEPSSPDPLVEALTVTINRSVWKGWPGYMTDQVSLPLKATATPVALANTRLGTIVHNADIATVSPTGDPFVKDGIVRINLTFAGLENYGEYEGKLDLLPDNDKAGEVTLKLVYTDYILFPLLLILAGVLLGFLASHWLGVTVRYDDLRARVAKLRHTFEDASGKFVRLAKGKPWQDYKIDAAVQAAQGDLVRQVDELRASHGISIPDDKFDDLVKEIEGVRQQIAGFGDFADELKGLSDNLNDLKANRPDPIPPDFDISNPPTAVSTLSQGLHGVTIQTLTELDDARHAVADAIARAHTWRLLEQEISKNEGEIRSRPASPELEQAERQLIGVYTQLWVNDPSEANLQRIEEAINQVTGAIGRAAGSGLPQPAELLRGALAAVKTGQLVTYSIQRPPLRSRNLTALAVVSLAVAAILALALSRVEWSVLDIHGHLPYFVALSCALAALLIGGWFFGYSRLMRWAHERLDEYTLFSWLRDGRAFFLFLFAVGLAVASGLSSQYAGKAFGESSWDYINVFVWGLTTKVVLDLVATGLNGIQLLRQAR